MALVARAVEGTLDSDLRVIEEPRVYSLAEAGRVTGIDADIWDCWPSRDPAGFQEWGEMVRG